MSNPLTLPPYGRFSVPYDRLATSNRLMSDWEPFQSAPVRRANFERWRNAVLDLLVEHLWPRYDAEAGGGTIWHGASAGFAEAATAAELQIMVRRFQATDILTKHATSPNHQSTPRTHLEHFIVEDDLALPAAINLRDYDTSLTAQQFEKALKIVTGAYDRTKIPGLFWFKGKLQRPRPYQAAAILGVPQFTHQVARTALHSSMNSGHCLEGILIGCAIADDWFRAGGYDSSQFASLRQFTVDFGDRRVFAGVHFPTDNIASWAIAESLIPHIYEHPEEVRAFFVDAVRQNSLVYQVIDEEYRSVQPLASAVALLDSVLGDLD